MFFESFRKKAETISHPIRYGPEAVNNAASEATPSNANKLTSTERVHRKRFNRNRFGFIYWGLKVGQENSSLAELPFNFFLQQRSSMPEFCVPRTAARHMLGSDVVSNRCRKKCANNVAAGTTGNQWLRQELI